MKARALLLVAGLALLGACDERSEPAAVTVADADTLISLESELVGSPVDLAVGGPGRVYLLDYLMNRIVLFDGASGATLGIIGRKGSGPAEFESPRALRVDGDTLRVVDAGNGRIQVLTAGGSFVRSQALPVRATAGRIDLAADGRMAIADPEVGSKRLITVIDPVGGVSGSFGEPVVEQPPIWDFRQIKREIARGRIPSILRNAASPVMSEDGSAWVVLVAEAALQRYDSRGRLKWTRPLEAPEIAAIREAFFARNREEQRPNAFYPLSYVADVARTGDLLWILVNTPEEHPAVLLVTRADGRPHRRLVIPGAAGARQFAVDPVNRRVYFAITSTATVVASSFPDSLRIWPTRTARR